MQIIRRRAYARAGLIGNPSDGYNGKTISVIVRNYWAQVVLYEWDRIEIVPSFNDDSVFRSLEELVQDVKQHGYYGGIRLVKAAIKGFAEYCFRRGISLDQRRNFSIRYETTIPRQVGMAGSSAIVVATMRALCDFYGVEIPSRIFPSLVLAVEREELGIPAGLQDRVIQVYEGAVYMDFGNMETLDGFSCGRYESIEPQRLPGLYISFSSSYSEPTEVFHNNLRFRYDQGEPAVWAAMQEFAALTDQAKAAIENGDGQELSRLMDRNFDRRRSICQLPKEHLAMIETARSVGVSAKFAGSGGAIIGVCESDTLFERLSRAMNELGCTCIRPELY